MSLRTKLAFFIPALRDLRASSRSSSSVNLTVRIAIMQLMLDVCHLYVKTLARGLVEAASGTDDRGRYAASRHDCQKMEGRLMHPFERGHPGFRVRAEATAAQQRALESCERALRHCIVSITDRRAGR
jgi:hypothetical protein